jgi:hypothetical protein
MTLIILMGLILISLIFGRVLNRNPVFLVGRIGYPNCGQPFKAGWIAWTHWAHLFTGTAKSFL